MRDIKYSPAEHEQDAIRAFAAAIQNAAVDESEWREKNATKEAALEQELERVKADTSAQDAARQRQEQVARGQEQGTRLERAREKLERARDRWKALTGRRPPG